MVPSMEKKKLKYVYSETEMCSNKNFFPFHTNPTQLLLMFTAKNAKNILKNTL